MQPNLYSEIDQCQICSNCNAEKEIKYCRLHTAMAENNHDVTSN